MALRERGSEPAKSWRGVAMDRYNRPFMAAGYQRVVG